MAPALIKIAVEGAQPARDTVVNKEAMRNGEGSKQMVEGYRSGVILPGGMSGKVSSQKMSDNLAKMAASVGLLQTGTFEYVSTRGASSQGGLS
jgi:hypothetical protein